MVCVLLWSPRASLTVQQDLTRVVEVVLWSGTKSDKRKSTVWIVHRDLRGKYSPPMESAGLWWTDACQDVFGHITSKCYGLWYDSSCTHLVKWRFEGYNSEIRCTGCDEICYYIAVILFLDLPPVSWFRLRLLCQCSYVAQIIFS